MYIVTGGAGFIGSAIIWRLNQAGIDDILVVDNLDSTDKWRNLVNLSYRAYMRSGEFLDCIATKRYVAEDIKTVIHMGACSDTAERDADYMLDNNLHYSQKVCRFALSIGARFIHASSAATYGDGSRGFSDNPDGLRKLKPLNIYGYSKHLFDLWAHREGILPHIASLKLFNVFGPNEYHKELRSMVCKAFDQINATGKIRLFRSDHPKYADGGQMRDFIYVKDCVEIIWQLLEHPRCNGLFNLGSGQARSWNDLAQAVFSALNLESAIEYIDMPENLKGCYQYYTQADMGWLDRAPFTRPSNFKTHTLEEAVHDYVRNYLLAQDKYL
jgi:ADP-L-glycero-D-manno-heptose 6-epimerase